nr:MAG TPA: hypothetical protein [Caudoviricetes sp.]
MSDSFANTTVPEISASTLSVNNLRYLPNNSRAFICSSIGAVPSYSMYFITSPVILSVCLLYPTIGRPKAISIRRSIMSFAFNPDASSRSLVLILM